MRLAIFGGVYSNHHALVATLADLARRGADAAFCLGDLGGFGPHPDRSAELLRASGVPTLRGNLDDSVGHDRADCACGYTDPRDQHFAQVSYDYTAARTAPEHKAWLRALPEQQLLEFAGALRVTFVRVAYDHEPLAREMEAERLPPEFVETIRTGWWTTCLENLPAKERRRGRY